MCVSWKAVVLMWEQTYLGIHLSGLQSSTFCSTLRYGCHWVRGKREKRMSASEAGKEETRGGGSRVFLDLVRYATLQKEEEGRSGFVQ